MKPRRQFHPRIKLAIIERQKGLCACGCKEALVVGNLHWDHALPLWLGGADEPENLRALVIRHHLKKTAREAGVRAKVRRIQQRQGMRLPRMSARDKVLAKMLEERGT